MTAFSADSEHITCPQCGRTSYNLGDIEQKYCGFCHQFHDQMAVAQIEELDNLLAVQDRTGFAISPGLVRRYLASIREIIKIQWKRPEPMPCEHASFQYPVDWVRENDPRVAEREIPSIHPKERYCTVCGWRGMLEEDRDDLKAIKKARGGYDGAD